MLKFVPFKLFGLIILVALFICVDSCLALQAEAQQMGVIYQAEELVEEYEGVYLEVNTEKNTLKVILNEKVQYTFQVATGLRKNLTPEGTYRIITKVKNPWYIPKKIPGGSSQNPLGTRWLGLDVPGTDGYKYGIHGTNQPASIGHSVSQGCIRMNNSDAEWLYRHIPVHTLVRITS